jgi:hypothetical protein
MYVVRIARASWWCNWRDCQKPAVGYLSISMPLNATKGNTLQVVGQNAFSTLYKQSISQLISSLGEGEMKLM